jgi:hypothetical protein
MLRNLLSRHNVTNTVCLAQCSGSETFRMDPDPEFYIRALRILFWILTFNQLLLFSLVFLCQILETLDSAQQKSATESFKRFITNATLLFSILA